MNDYMRILKATHALNMTAFSVECSRRSCASLGSDSIAADAAAMCQDALANVATGLEQIVAEFAGEVFADMPDDVREACKQAGMTSRGGE